MILFILPTSIWLSANRSSYFSLSLSLSLSIYIYIYTRWNDKIVALEKTTWFHFCLMKTGCCFFVAAHLLVCQLCTNPKSDCSLLSCLKVTQCSTCEIGDAPLYNLCSLPIQVMTTRPLPAPSKWKSGRFNAWGHSSTHRTTLWGRGAESQGWGHHQEDPDQGVHRKGPGNHWWNSQAAYSADCQRFRCLTHNCECTCEGRLEVQVLQALDQSDLYWEDKEPQANQVRQVADLNPLDYFVWSYVENITNMTSHNTKASLINAIRRVFTELPPALVEKAFSQFQIRIESVIEAEGGYIE